MRSGAVPRDGDHVRMATNGTVFDVMLVSTGGWVQRDHDVFAAAITGIRPFETGAFQRQIAAGLIGWFVSGVVVFDQFLGSRHLQWRILADFVEKQFSGSARAKPRAFDNVRVATG